MMPEEQEAHNEWNDGRTRWKYKTLTLHEGELTDQLTTHGVFGWELAAMHPDKRNNSSVNCFIVVMKRPFWFEQPPEPSNE